MEAAHSLVDHIHTQAFEISRRYLRAEGELLSILQQVEEHRVFIRRGHSSLFQYVVRELGLGENAAYGLITVARKAREVPALQAKIESGEITLSNARRVSSVITPENQAEWMEKAAGLSNRQLEKEIVRVRPEEAVRERAAYVSPSRVRLELGLSENEMLRLRRVQDLLSQARRSAVTLEETVQALTQDYLRRNDPVEKAKRDRVKKGPVAQSAATTDGGAVGDRVVGVGAAGMAAAARPSGKTEAVGKLVTFRVHSKRVPIPAAVLHQVNFRDRRRCMHVLDSGQACGAARWIEIHHRIPISEGGTNALENLVTLCSAHHKFLHLKREPSRCGS